MTIYRHFVRKFDPLNQIYDTHLHCVAVIAQVCLVMHTNHLASRMGSLDLDFRGTSEREHGQSREMGKEWVEEEGREEGRERWEIRMELTNSFLPTFECRRRLYVTSVDSHAHRPHTHTER